MERKFWKKCRNIFLVIAISFLQQVASSEENGVVEYVCPVDFLELDEMVANENWSVTSFTCKAYILPDYFMKNVTNGQDLPGTFHRNPTVEFLSNMHFTLEKYAYDDDDESTQGSLISQMHCNFTDMLQLKTRMFSPEESIPDSGIESSMGYLYFEDLSLERKSEQYYELPSMFSLGDVALPSVKGMYTLSVARPTSKNYTIISNMRKYKTKPHLGVDGLVWDVFQETLPLYPEQLSVYILGGNTEVVEYKDEEMNRTVSVIWRPELITEINEKQVTHEEMTDIHNCYAKLGAKLLTTYEEIFGVKYPLDKLDIFVTSKKINYHPWLSGKKSVGVTDIDFSLYVFHGKDGICSKDQVQHMQPLISSIVQQWTGPIEMSSSKHSKTAWLAVIDHLILWGIDNVMGHKLAVDRYMHWRIYDMAHDPSIHHQHRESKASVIFKMIQDVFTRPVFEEGIINNFIKKAHNPENGRYETDDIFDAIQEAIEIHNKTHLLPNGATLKNIVENWLEIQGPPLIRVQVMDSDEDSYNLKISQETELSGGGDNNDTFSNSTQYAGFWIPLEIVTNLETHFLWLSNTKNNTVVTFSLPLNTTQYVLVNPNITGDFRILYDSGLTSLLTKQLVSDHTVLPAEMRSRLIQNYFLFARKGQVEMDSALEMTKYLEQERDSLVWLVVTSNINFGYWASGVNAVTYEKLQNYFNSIVDSALMYYKFGPFHEIDIMENGTNSCDSLSKRELMRSCILNKTPACKEYAKELMKVWQNDSNGNPFSGFNNMDKELLQCLALRDTSPGDDTGIFNFFLGKKFNESIASPQEKQCLYPTEMQAAWLCTGNETMILTLFEDVVENYYLNFEDDMCYGIQNNIVANFPSMGKPVYDILRNSQLNGTLKAGLLADFVRVLGPYDLEDESVINDLDKLLLEYRGNATLNLEDSFYAGAVEDLQESADHLKERMTKRNNEYAKSGLRWLELRGY